MSFYASQSVTLKSLYDACDTMDRPAGCRYTAGDWWRALLAFAYLIGWRIGKILELRRDDLDLKSGIATVDADSTKGRCTARAKLHPVVIDRLRSIVEFSPLVFGWPHHESTLWADFGEMKTAANVDSIDPALLQN